MLHNCFGLYNSKSARKKNFLFCRAITIEAFHLIDIRLWPFFHQVDVANYFTNSIIITNDQSGVTFLYQVCFRTAYCRLLEIFAVRASALASTLVSHCLDLPNNKVVFFYFSLCAEVS
jgi:hypothetical protein